jgi:hypothetical protein
MLQNMLRNFIFIFIVMCFSHSLLAQGNHFSIGIGPSLLYSDNSGEYRQFNFKIQPAISLSFNQQLSENIGLRGSVGAQIFNSGEYYVARSNKIVRWGDKDQAFAFKGRGYFADLMPVFTTNPNSSGMLNSSLQFYAGLGLGLMFVEREQETLKNGIVKGGVLISGDIISSNETDLIPYIPIRTGISTNLSGNWDFALEFVLMTALSSELDGNNIKDKLLTPDMSGQIQFVVKRYFGQAW